MLHGDLQYMVILRYMVITLYLYLPLGNSLPVPTLGHSLPACPFLQHAHSMLASRGVLYLWMPRLLDRASSSGIIAPQS